MKPSSIARQEKRIAKLLRRALAVALATPAVVLGAQACTGDLAPATTGGADGSTTSNACAPYIVEADAGELGSGGCTGDIQRLPCGIPSGTKAYGDCYFSVHDCATLCSGPTYSCRYHGDCDGGFVDTADTLIECATSCLPQTGRRPDGLRSSRPGQHRASPVGDYFASATHLEAASVQAFRILERELAELGAPDDLLRAAERARNDEIRHARMMARIANRHGGRPARARVAKEQPRSLESIAIENVVEGCVRETFGALVAKHQAAKAKDAAIAQAMTGIAEDETRHAALAWSVAAWAETKLDAAANSRVRAAKEKALRDLEAEIGSEPHPSLVRVAGVPSAATQRAMLVALFAA